MRSLIITSILFLLLILCIILNSLYIHRCADQISAMAEMILEGNDAAQLETFWKNNRSYIGISISEDQVDNISRIIASVRINQESGNMPELEKDIAHLLQAAESMRQYERLSLQSLF